MGLRELREAERAGKPLFNTIVGADWTLAVGRARAERAALGGLSPLGAKIREMLEAKKSAKPETKVSQT